jgi:hypothetical protein
LITAGRCVGSDRETNSAIRVKASCMAMGQAAGAAAYISIEDCCDFGDADPIKIKRVLRDNGAIVPR